MSDKKPLTELERCEIAKKQGFTYDPITGILRGINDNLVREKRKGYLFCKVFRYGSRYNIAAHRLAWFLYYGELPKNHIDHIDGDRANNKIDNLRDVTQQQNTFNNSKAKGCYWHKRDKKFHTRIQIDGKTISIGYFNTEKEAYEAYIDAKNKYHIIPTRQNNEF